MAHEQKTAVSIQSLTHRYGKTIALDHISLSIPTGADVAFIGPDGVGKSTLLGLIGGVLVVFPAMLTALGIVREKEMGSITNVYASPATVGEYLIGKQLPYIAIGLVSFVSLLALSAGLFGVVPKGSVTTLAVAALIYVFAATAFGLLVSAFASTQVAAIYGTSIATAMTAAHYSGFLFPASSLEGVGRIMGLGFPALWFQTINLGVFAKGLSAAAFLPEMTVLIGFGILFLVLARLFVRKQGV